MKNIRTYTKKLRSLARRGGEQVTYASLLLFHAFKSKETPCWAKNVIFGALAYLITPIDTVPDLTPLLGYTDDLGVLSFALVGVACYITESVRDKAREHLMKLFGEINPANVAAVDAKI